MCHRNVYFAFFAPSILHLLAYIYTVYLFRIKENEQLQNLMERAFLLSSNPTNRGCQKHLVRILCLFIVFGVTWVMLALLTICLMASNRDVTFQWFQEK